MHAKVLNWVKHFVDDFNTFNSDYEYIMLDYENDEILKDTNND